MEIKGLKLKNIFTIAYVFQILLFIGPISLFLVGYWGYDGSGGTAGDMYLRQIFYNILAFYSSPMMVLVCAPLSLICFLLGIFYFLRVLFKKAGLTSLKAFIVFLIITIINTCIYAFALLIYTNYSWFA